MIVKFLRLRSVNYLDFTSNENNIASRSHMRGSIVGGGGGPGPLENHKNIGFLSNTGPGPDLKSQSYQTIQCEAIIDTQAKRHLNGISLAGR